MQPFDLMYTCISLVRVRFIDPGSDPSSVFVCVSRQSTVGLRDRTTALNIAFGSAVRPF